MTEQPAAADLDDLTAIRARVREVLTRTGLSEAAFVALLGITADKVRASLAGERRFSTYELAVIAMHGRTTVEWLCGEDPEYDPMPPETPPGHLGRDYFIQSQDRARDTLM